MMSDLLLALENLLADYQGGYYATSEFLEKLTDINQAMFLHYKRELVQKHEIQENYFTEKMSKIEALEKKIIG